MSRRGDGSGHSTGDGDRKRHNTTDTDDTRDRREEQRKRALSKKSNSGPAKTLVDKLTAEERLEVLLAVQDFFAQHNVSVSDDEVCQLVDESASVSSMWERLLAQYEIKGPQTGVDLRKGFSFMQRWDSDDSMFFAGANDWPHQQSHRLSSSSSASGQRDVLSQNRRELWQQPLSYHDSSVVVEQDLKLCGLSNVANRLSETSVRVICDGIATDVAHALGLDVDDVYVEGHTGDTVHVQLRISPMQARQRLHQRLPSLADTGYLRAAETKKAVFSLTKENAAQLFFASL
jgi:hypothetical protein